MKLCGEAPCEREAKAKGRCIMHYGRAWKELNQHKYWHEKGRSPEDIPTR